MTAGASIYTHLAAFLGYSAFGVVLAFRSSRSWLTASFILAALFTALWSGSVALAEAGLLPDWLPEFVAPLRDGYWYAIVLTVLWMIGPSRTQWRIFACATAVVVAANAVFAGAQLHPGSLLGVSVDARTIALIQL